MTTEAGEAVEDGGAALSCTAPSGSHGVRPPSGVGATLSVPGFDVHRTWTP